MSEDDDWVGLPGTIRQRAQELADQRTGGYPLHDLRPEDRDHFIKLAIDEKIYGQPEDIPTWRNLGWWLCSLADRIFSKGTGKQ